MVKVASHLHVEWIDDEAVILDTETSQLHHLNGSAALVYALIEEFGYVEAMLELSKRFPGMDGSHHEVAHLIDDMKERGLLVDE